MPHSPISLSDVEITTIMQCSRPLQPEDRARFIELVASRLRACKEIGEGEVWRACVDAQRALFCPPIETRSGVGKYG
jgi:hypothetical protein